ncbi:MAG: site-specific DNA-methyltransferase [Lachnospiraceae bacterium]|nr:site-specific DNA-methyltransferase [Lachnospiraceae bacterium]
MKENIIINGDCIEKLKDLDEKSVDLIFADPPYWMRTGGILKRVEGTDFDGCHDAWDRFSSLEDYEEFTRLWLTACRRVLKDNGSIWVIGGMQCIYTIGAAMQDTGFWLINDVIWHKKNPTPNFMGTRLANSHETLIWAARSKSSAYTFNYKTGKELNHDTVNDEEFRNGVRKQMGSVWRIAVCNGSERLKDQKGDKVHSTQKPLDLLERIIAISSKPGDLVLDPFAGTMTTGVAAKKLGRNYIMIERDKGYCSYGKDRLDATDFCDTPIARAEYDKKPPKVTVQEMIKNGVLMAGEDFYLKKGGPVATLRSDGKLEYKGTVMDMHSCAAVARGSRAERLNGFDFWFVLRDGKLRPIADIREEYRKTIY